MLDVVKIKKDFPIFKAHPDLVYLDSAVTSLKPQAVIDKLTEYYASYSANIKRGIYKISEQATAAYEDSRAAVASLIGSKIDEVIFTKSTTESLNLVAYSLGRQIVDEESEVIVSVMDHHSNFVPWQILAQETGAVFKVIDVDSQGTLNIKQVAGDKINLDGIITKKTKILALPYVSNVLGTINPIKAITAAAKKINPKLVVVVDAAQAVGHMPVNVKDLGVDFLAFSGHKIFGPTGIGVLWGKEKLLTTMYPFLYGGEMIEQVSIEKTTFAPIPEKFEAGTPPIAEAIALKEAIAYMHSLGLVSIENHTRELVQYALHRLTQEFGNSIEMYGPKDSDLRGGVLAFSLAKVHPHDIAQILDEENIAIRAGHHCTMPLHNRIGVAASARISPSIYNDKDDIEKLIIGLKKVEKMFVR